MFYSIFLCKCIFRLKCLQICVYCRTCCTNLWMSEGKANFNKKKTLTMIWFVCFFTADTIKDAVMLTIARLTLTSTLIKGQEKYADNAVRFTHLYLRGTIRPGCTTQNFSMMAIKVIFST